MINDLTIVNPTRSIPPKVGEIRYATEIKGRGGSSRYVWRPCQDCGVSRWVELRKDRKLNQLRCRSCTNKARWSDAEYKISTGKAIREACSRPEYRDADSKRAKERWADPKFRGKCCEKMREVWSNSELLLRVSGENSYLWKGGISIEPYTAEFNRRLKRTICKRDNYTCQVCGKRRYGMKLDVHHINYDKKCSTHDNLISLCSSCHGKTSINRRYWVAFLRRLLIDKYGYDCGKEDYIPIIYIRRRSVNPVPPVVGEIRHSLEIDGKKGYDRWIWQECPICKVPKWKRLAKSKPYHLKCLRCYLDRRKKGINNNSPKIVDSSEPIVL